MELKLKRIALKKEYTIGRLYIDGKYFCDVIEDVDRGLDQKMPLEQIKRIKVMHQTAIPTGVYKVRLSMSPRFKRILPEILAVPGFSGIRIHNGKDQNSSSGCLIVGKNTIVGQVTNSKYWMEKLISILQGATNITIQITK